jgi:hypothetical protein
VLLFQKRFHQGLVAGTVRLTFRRWAKPHVRAGGRYRCHPIGVLEVDAVDRVRVADIDEADAARAGFGSRAELVAYMAGGPGGAVDPAEEVFRVELHHGGDGDRVAIALDADLGDGEVAALRARLERMGDWTVETLRLIGRRPRVAASKLALGLGRETAPFKVDVRKLKKLGLTQSFEVGYELSPRGRALLAALGRRRPRRITSPPAPAAGGRKGSRARRRSPRRARAAAPR